MSDDDDRRMVPTAAAGRGIQAVVPTHAGDGRGDRRRRRSPSPLGDDRDVGAPTDNIHTNSGGTTTAAATATATAAAAARAGVRRRDDLARPPVRRLRGSSTSAAAYLQASPSSSAGAAGIGTGAGAGAGRGSAPAGSIGKFPTRFDGDSGPGGDIGGGGGISSSSSRHRNSSWSDLANRVERRRSRSNESFHDRLTDRLDPAEEEGDDDNKDHADGHDASSPPQARRAQRQQHRRKSLGSHDDAPNYVHSTQVRTSDHRFGLARPPVRSLRTNRGVGSRRTSHTSSTHQKQNQRRGSAGSGGDGSLSAAALAAAAAFAREHSIGETERRRSGTRLGLGLGLGGAVGSGGDLAAMAMGGGEDMLPPLTISVPVVKQEKEQQQEQADGDAGEDGDQDGAVGAAEHVGKDEENDGEANNLLTMSLERSSNHDSVPSVASSSSVNRSTRSMSRSNLAQPNRRASASDTSSAGGGGGRSSRRSSAARQVERRRSSAKYGISVVDQIKLDLGSAANSSYSGDDDDDDNNDDYDDDASLDEQALAEASASDRQQLSAANTNNSSSHHSTGIGRREGTASKRGSFAQEALSSLVAVFQSSKGTLDVDGLAGSSDDEEEDGNASGNPTDARSHGSAGGASRAANSVDAAVDALVITDDEDDDEGHDHDDDDAVPAPIPLDGQRPAGMPRSTMLGSGNKKFLPGASVRRHGSKATAGDKKDGGAAGSHSLGAYGAGAAEAAESAARAAAEFVTDEDGVVSPRKRSTRGSSRADEGGDDDNDDANADGMQVDFPTERRRGSWNEDPTSKQKTSLNKMKRHGSYTSSAYSSTDSLASSMYEQNMPAQINKPTTAPPGGGQSMVFGGSGADNEPIESVPEGEVGDESGSNDDDSKSDDVSSSSSDSVSIASDDICNDPDPPTLVAKGFVPCSFVADAQNSSNIKLNMYESSQNLDYTASGLAQQENNDSGDKALTTFNPAYLDAEMAAGIQGGKLLPATSAKFAAEHYLFIRAVLQLLGERDRVGVEANMDDPHTIKAGSLKKSSSNLPGVWKVKFVEIRRGIFSYYEDKPSAGGGDSLLRRNIPLRSSLCTCRAVKLRHPSLDVGPRTSIFGGGSKGSGGGYVFELSVQGGRRRLWMASSKEERQAWIRAIHEAMIGVSQTVPRRDSGNSRHPLLPWIAPPKDDCDQYLKIQAATKAATSEAAYISAVTPVWNTTLCIPVQRIREQAETVATFDSPDNSRHHEARTRLQMFWDDLSHNSLTLNGHTLLGEHKYGPERMVGALTRCILEYDRLANEKDAAAPDRRTGNFRRASTVSSSAAEQMTEVQAIGYARDILLGCNRSGSGRDDDSFYSVETLFGNNDFAVLIPSSQMEPVSVDVSNVNADDDEATGLQNNATRGGNSFERSGWVDYRTKSSKKWKRRYCVLSEGVISIYENGYPRPHGLKDQLVLVDAAISTTGGPAPGYDMDDDDSKSGDESKQSSPERSVRKHAVFIKTRDASKPKHYVAFEYRAEMMGWAEAIRSSIETCSPEGIVTEISMSEGGSSFNETDVSIERKKGLLSTFRPPFMGGGSGAITPPDESRGSLFGNIRKGGRSSEDTSIRAPPQDDPNSSKRNKFFRNPKRAPSTGSIMAALQADKYPDATVRISVQSSTMYKLCTSNPDGDENQDTWGMVRTKLLRNYLLAGGPNGRMIRGEDIVELEFLKGIVREETFHLIFSKKEALANIGEISASRK